MLEEHRYNDFSYVTGEKEGKTQLSLDRKEYTIDKLLGVYINREGELLYWVKWEGWPNHHGTWELY